MRDLGRIAVLAFAAAVLAQPAHALDAAGKCEAGKNKAVGKYFACRHAAYGKAIKTEGGADFTKCDEKFADSWSKLETKAEGACPTNSDSSSIQSYLSGHAQIVATALHGSGLCDFEFGGECWFLGSAGQSCDQVCGAHYRPYDSATSSVAGSGSGSAANCEAILNGLGAPGSGMQSGFAGCAGGYGCTTSTGMPFRARCTNPATDSGSSAFDVLRACACQ